MIDIDRAFFRLSSSLEFYYQMYINDERYLDLLIETLIDIFETKPIIRERLYAKLKDYLLKRTPHDFYYLGKKNIKRVLKRKSITEQR